MCGMRLFLSDRYKVAFIFFSLIGSDLSSENHFSLKVLSKLQSFPMISFLCCPIEKKSNTKGVTIKVQLPFSSFHEE